MKRLVGVDQLQAQLENVDLLNTIDLCTCDDWKICMQNTQRQYTIVMWGAWISEIRLLMSRFSEN